jgi:hypothetical protein
VRWLLTGPAHSRLFGAEAAPDDCHVQIDLADPKIFKKTMSHLYAADKKFSCRYKL